MGYSLGNKLGVSVYIEDFELPLDGYMSVLNLHIGSTLRMKVPTMSLQVSDYMGVLDAIPLVRDATRITVLINAGTQENWIYPFRLFIPNRIPDPSGGAVWTLECYFDAPVWWAGTSTRSYVGTSHDVLKQLAETCNIEFVGEQTADNQSWYQQSSRYSEFARHVARHGYKNPSSRMTLGYDLTNKLIYRDVSVPQAPFITVVNGRFQEGCAFATHYQTESVSGYTNRNVGYQSTMFRQSLYKPAELNSLSFTPNVTDPNYNSGMKTIIQSGKPRHSLVDVGNSSENMERAKFQNTKFAQMFNQTLHLSSDYLPMPFPLLSWINCSLYGERSGDPDTLNSGVYLVTGRAIIIRGTYYLDKIQCERHGVNAGER